MRSACVPRIKLCFTYLHKWTGCLDSACNSKHKRTSHGGLPSWGCICSPESWFWKSRQRFVQSEVLPRTFLVNNLGMGPSISQRSAFTPLRPYYTQVDPPNLPYSKFFLPHVRYNKGTIHHSRRADKTVNRWGFSVLSWLRGVAGGEVHLHLGRDEEPGVLMHVDGTITVTCVNCSKNWPDGRNPRRNLILNQRR